MSRPLLVLSPRAGVVAGLLFHTSINLLPLNYAAGFSLMCVARYGLFLPATPDALASLAPRSRSANLYICKYPPGILVLAESATRI